MAKIFVVLCLPVSGLAMAVFPQTGSQPQKQKSETFSALAYLPAGAGPRMVAPGANMNVTIYIKRYSTDAEAHQLHDLRTDFRDSRQALGGDR